MTGVTPAIMVFIFGGLFSGYLALLEFLKEKTNWWKFSFELFLFCGFIFWGIVDILNKDTSAKSDKKEIIDTVSATHKDLGLKLDTTGLKIDSGFDGMGKSIQGLSRKLDTGFKGLLKPFPADKMTKKGSLVEIYAPPVGQANPIIREISSDSLSLDLTLYNSGEGAAFNFKDISVSVAEIQGNLILSAGPFPSAFNKYYKLGGHQLVTANFPFKRLSRIPAKQDEKYFFCSKITYSDSLTKRDSLVCIYITTDLPLNKGLLIPGSEIFNKIESLLVGKKMW